MVPLEVALLFLGITFVLRNKVDVPKYELAKDMKKLKKPKKKPKGKPGEEGDPNAQHSGLDVDINSS